MNTIRPFPIVFLILAWAVQPVAAQDCCAAISDDLVAWWKLDEALGNTSGEQTGQHAGTWAGNPSPIPGKVAGALHLDGAGDFVSVPDSPDWTLSGDFTIELWSQWDTPVNASNPSNTLMGQDEGGGSKKKWILMSQLDPFASSVTGSALTFHINFPGSPNGGNGLWPAVPFNPEVGRWYHIAVTRSTSTYTFYVDGDEAGKVIETAAIPDVSAPLNIGWTEGINYARGSLDEVAIYGRALSASEIQQIADSGSIGKCDLVFGSPCAPYCTAGVSTSGCQASIGAVGQPSASATSGFYLSADTVEGAKDGMFFYGANGRQAVTWGTGFQCVVPPVLRGPLQAGVGTASACDGVFSLDLNARWCPTCPKPSQNPGPGAVIQAQFWYRDPWNTSTTKTTTLSDAIEFTVAP